MTAVQGEFTAGRLEALNSEYQICRRKLESKCEALLILSKELDQCRSERDQFKLMAEQLRDRYQMVKRQLTGDTPLSASLCLNDVDPKTFSDIQSQGLTRLLFDTKENNKSLKFEVDDLRQKLQDAEGDIKLLREQIARSRVGTTDEGLTTRHFPAHEREDLVRQLEASREEFVQLERDLQQVLDEKEELETERDAYRTKYERLNTELNYILRGDDKRIVDIDALSMENKFLQERLKQMEEEKTMAIATVTKYKNILEKKKTKGILKLGQSRSGGLVITQRQVHQMIQAKSSIAPTPQALADLQGLCAALLDTINDKNLALSHQRKTNKLLGNRVSELEKKLKTLEVSGLWSVSGNMNSLEKLKAECHEIKTLVPRQFSQSTETSETPQDLSDLDSTSTSRNNSVTTSPTHMNSITKELSRLDLEELDLLPTKEEVVKGNGGNTESLTEVFNDGIGCTDIRNGTPLVPGISSTDSLLSDNALDLSGNKESSEIEKLRGFENGTERQDLTYNWKLSIRECLDCDEINERMLKEKICGKDDLEDPEENLSHLLKDSWVSDVETFNDDEDEETNEHLKALMDCVTTKLLQRSHQQGAPVPNWSHDKESETTTVLPCLSGNDAGCDSSINNIGILSNYNIVDENSIPSYLPNAGSFREKTANSSNEETANLLSDSVTADDDEGDESQKVVDC